MEKEAGVISFSIPEQALSGIEEINNRYKFHCSAAREVSREYFDATEILHHFPHPEAIFEQRDGPAAPGFQCSGRPIWSHPWEDTIVPLFTKGSIIALLFTYLEKAPILVVARPSFPKGNFSRLAGTNRGSDNVTGNKLSWVGPGPARSWLCRNPVRAYSLVLNEIDQGPPVQTLILIGVFL